jgi:hypothetical protein
MPSIYLESYFKDLNVVFHTSYRSFLFHPHTDYISREKLTAPTHIRVLSYLQLSSERFGPVFFKYIYTRKRSSSNLYKNHMTCRLVCIRQQILADFTEQLLEAEIDHSQAQ